MIKLFKPAEDRSDYIGRQVLLTEEVVNARKYYQQIYYKVGFEIKANPHNKIKTEYEDGIIRKAIDDE